MVSRLSNNLLRNGNNPSIADGVAAKTAAGNDISYSLRFDL